jgi:hypothetical protein
LKTIIKCSSVAFVLSHSAWAIATPRSLPFTYPYETLSEGELEIELYGDVTPLRVFADASDPTGVRLWEPAYLLQSEIEYGVSDRVELGFYQVFEAQPTQSIGGTNAMTFDGFKWRVRTRLAEAGEWPIDVGLYLELETMHDEVALEEKVLLSKRLKRWHLMANLWVEESERRPLDGEGERSFHFIVNPTSGFVYQVTPVFQPGLEYWARGEFGTDDVNDRIFHFLGPTVHFNFGKLWWSLGVYADLGQLKPPQPGDIYGPVWVRTVLGLNP